ncbi:MAG: hypothetical protein WD802_09060 [Gemmatimonadaceae bacterium]
MSIFYLVQSGGLVRPGTSAALTARTIDATVHPVTQARDAVAEVPGLVDSIPPHLVGGALGLTGVLVMLSLQRYRLSMSPVLLAGLLMMPVSNYRPSQQPDGSKPLESAVVEKKEAFKTPDWYERPTYAEEPEPARAPRAPRPFPDFSIPSIDIEIPPELMEEAGTLIELVVPEDWDREDVTRYLRRNSERLRREIRRLRSHQEREERRARRHAYSMEHRHHHHHSR